MTIETHEEAALAASIATRLQFPRTPDYFYQHNISSRFNLKNARARHIAEEITSAITLMRRFS